MGLLELLLGANNPAAKWAGENRNLLGAFGAGIAQAPDLATGIGTGLSYLPKVKEMDREDARFRREEKQQNYTTDLFKRDAPDLFDALQGGAPMGELWNEYLRRKNPATAEMQNPYMSAGDGQFFNWQTGEYVTNPNAPPAASGDQPAAVQEYQFAVSQGYDKPFTTFIQEKGRNSGTPPATIAKEIFEADEGAQAGENVLLALDRALELNTTAGDGPLADVWSSGAALLGDPRAVETQELKNIVTANALESLKATFGAAPTEGERKILLEIQGSINQSRPVREAIFKRARAAAERRLAFNKERALSLRGGEYFDPGYSPVGGAPTGNQTSTGVTWSIEP